MTDQGYKIVSLKFTSSESTAEGSLQPKPDHLQRDVTDQELDEISEIRKLVTEITEPDLLSYTST